MPHAYCPPHSREADRAFEAAQGRTSGLPSDAVAQSLLVAGLLLFVAGLFVTGFAVIGDALAVRVAG